MSQNQLQFKPAQRKKAKARIAISSPSGGGKTMGALMLAAGLGGKIAMIDTENGSASLYSGMPWCPEFDTLELKPPFSPESFIAAIQLAETSGYDIIIVDSTTHEWNGSGGCLEINDTTAVTKYRGNSWSAWNETTPRHRRFIDKMLQSPCHIIATMRSKTDTAQQEVNGRKTVVKLGLKSEQRDGIEYEFTAVLDLIHDGHWAIASKDRTGLFKEPEVITRQMGERMREWLEDGVDAEAIEKKRLEDEKQGAVHSICCAETADELKTAWVSMPAHLKPALNDLKDFKKFDIMFNKNGVFQSKELGVWHEFTAIPEPYAALILRIDACTTREELELINKEQPNLVLRGVLNQYYVNKFSTFPPTIRPDGKLD